MAIAQAGSRKESEPQSADSKRLMASMQQRVEEFTTLDINLDRSEQGEQKRWRSSTGLSFGWKFGAWCYFLLDEIF